MSTRSPGGSRPAGSGGGIGGGRGRRIGWDFCRDQAGRDRCRDQAGRDRHGQGWHQRSGPDCQGRFPRPPGQHSDRHPGQLAVFITLVQVVGTAVVTRGQPDAVDVIGYALLALSGVALAARVTWPAIAFAVATGATVAYHGLGYPGGPTFVAAIFAGVMAAKAGRRWQVTAILIASYGAWVGLTAPGLNRALVMVAWLFGGLLAAEWIRVAGQYRDRAAQADQERARAHDEQQRRQASEERLRIARELHDVLGHHLSLINVQAGVGLHLMDRSPEQARAALGTIKQASAEALGEVRSVLGALNPSDEAAPRAPAPRLARLAELTTDAGIPVETSVRGQPRPLPPEVDRAAYRIVQESLTNVRRHAGGDAAASVLIEYGQAGLRVVVADDGTGAPAETPVVEGNGIGGMRERAGALGGSLTAAGRAEGGFAVRAWLPLPGPEPPPATPSPGTPADPPGPADGPGPADPPGPADGPGPPDTLARVDRPAAERSAVA